MAEKEDTEDRASAEEEKKRARKERFAQRRSQVFASVAAMRATIAKIVLIVCTIIAALLAVGALLVAMRHNINPQNAVVKMVMDIDDKTALWFDRKNGVFDFSGKHPETKNALVNWGIAALLWLGVGSIASKLIRP